MAPQEFVGLAARQHHLAVEGLCWTRLRICAGEIKSAKIRSQHVLQKTNRDRLLDTPKEKICRWLCRSSSHSGSPVPAQRRRRVGEKNPA